MKSHGFNPRFDVYIQKAQPFAQPILNHLRELIHQACPEVVEEIKWSRPFFLINGVILCNIAGFKEHCSIGIWGHEMQQILAADGVKFEGSMGTFGRIASLRDLPPDKTLLGYFRQAVGFIATGERTTSYARPRRVAKPPHDVPVELTAALRKSNAAEKIFAAFSPSAQREYTDWIAEAKRSETRQKRINQAVEWIAEGKQRHWKYETK